MKHQAGMCPTPSDPKHWGERSADCWLRPQQATSPGELTLLDSRHPPREFPAPGASGEAWVHPSLEKQLIPLLEVMCEWRTTGKGEEPEVNRDASSFRL